MNGYDIAIYLLDKVIRLATVSEEMLGETCFRDLMYVAETNGRTELIEPADKLFDLAGELHVTIEPVKKLAEEMKREYQRIQRGLPPKARETDSSQGSE